MAHLETHSPGRALDLGCGTGTNVITMAERGWKVTGVDFAWRAIQIARRKARRAGIKAEFKVGDVTRVKGIHPPFQLVLDMGCFHSLPEADQEVYARRVKNWLDTNGTFLLYAFFRPPGTDGPGIQEETLQLFSPDLVLQNRQDGLERETRPSAWFTFVKEGG